MKRYHFQSDPDRNPNFRRNWRFKKHDRQFDHLPALAAQAERDLEARQREGIPLPRVSAALFAGSDA